MIPHSSGPRVKLQNSGETNSMESPLLYLYSVRSTPFGRNTVLKPSSSFARKASTFDFDPKVSSLSFFIAPLRSLLFSISEYYSKKE